VWRDAAKGKPFAQPDYLRDVTGLPCDPRLQWPPYMTCFTMITIWLYR